LPSSFNTITAQCDPIFQNAFGETITYFYGDQPSAELKALLSQELLEMDSLTHAPIYSAHLTVDLRRADLAREPKSGDQLRVRGTLYKASEVKPDLYGGVKLTLMKVENARTHSN
jgi:hypothetical protein